MTSMSRYTSYGICALCGKRTTKAAMTRHLGHCVAAHEGSSRAQAAKLLRLRVEDSYSPIYWMDVEMKASATLEKLDDFLRMKWLECCSHLSAFEIGGVSYNVLPDSSGGLFPGDPVERNMKIKLEDVLDLGERFDHIYDFGTSTELKLRVADEREGHLPGRQSLRLLSQNEAPVWECEVCGKEAEWICTYCMYEQQNPFYCEAHADDHDCGEPEMILPVVNSPRMGECGYEGPA